MKLSEMVANLELEVESLNRALMVRRQTINGLIDQNDKLVKENSELLERLNYEIPYTERIKSFTSANNDAICFISWRWYGCDLFSRR